MAPEEEAAAITKPRRLMLPSAGVMSPSTNAALVAAARNGDVGAIGSILDEVAAHQLFHIDAADRFGRSLLWYAAINGHLEACQTLINRGAHIGCRDMVGWMPIHLASYQGHVEIVRLLLERQAEVDAKTWAGQTPRWLAHSNARPGCGQPSDRHAEIAGLLEERGGTLGLPPPDFVNPRRPRHKRPIPPDEVRLCVEDGEKYNVGQLIQTYVHEKQMFTQEECEDYFRREMLLPPDHHAAFQLPVLERIQPGENKYG